MSRMRCSEGVGLVAPESEGWVMEEDAVGGLKYGYVEGSVGTGLLAVADGPLDTFPAEFGCDTVSAGATAAGWGGSGRCDAVLRNGT